MIMIWQLVGFCFDWSKRINSGDIILFLIPVCISRPRGCPQLAFCAICIKHVGLAFRRGVRLFLIVLARAIDHLASIGCYQCFPLVTVGGHV